MSLLFMLWLIPILTALVMKLIDRDLQWPFVAAGAGVGVLILSIVYGCGYYTNSWDTEIINGEVTSKERVKVSCSHSYECNCYTTKNSDGSTSEHCSTCYEHSYDVDWEVHSNVGEFDIDRVNRQGTEEPPRWTAVKIGEPVAREHTFTNYVKAVPDSLFHQNETHKFDKLIPAYPSEVFDYMHVNRAISVGVPVPDIANWNNDIAVILKRLGPAKQANLIILFVNTVDQSYLNALEGKWVGGKKNDIIVVVGSTQYPKIDWLAVSSWTDNQLFKVRLRDDLNAVGQIDRAQFIKIIEADSMELYKRKHMKEFEYLKDSIKPSTFVIMLSAFLGLIASMLTIFFINRNTY